MEDSRLPFYYNLRSLQLYFVPLVPSSLETLSQSLEEKARQKKDTYVLVIPNSRWGLKPARIIFFPEEVVVVS